MAKKLGRRFIGLELSEQYAKRIDDRLAAISSGDPLDGAPEPLKSSPATKDGRRLASKTRGARKKASPKKAAVGRRIALQKGGAPR